jgi:hypothetical protein
MIYAKIFQPCLGILFAVLFFPRLASFVPRQEIVTAQQNVFYVASSGDDSNPGTASQPWRTIQNAANTLMSGDTVYIRAGTFNERVLPQNSGSDSDHIITYAAYPGETVTIDGTGIAVPTDEGLIYVSGKNYVAISGLRVINSNDAGILVDNSGNILVEANYTYNTASSGIGVWASHDIIVDGNEVELANSNGMQESLTVAGTATFEVKNNLVHNGVAGYDKEGICIKDGASNGKVYRNQVHHTAAVGIYVDAWNKLTSNIDVFQNVVHDVSANGIALASESGGLLQHVRVYNNIVYHNQLVGIWLSGCCSIGAASHPMSDLKIINNTLYDNGWGLWGGGIAIDQNPDIQNVIIRNNLTSQNLSFQITIDPIVPTQTLTIDHNLIDGYRGGEGEIYGAYAVVGEPRFVNSSTADFHLQQNSPAINTGSSLDAPADDYEGHPRPQLSAFDIGAFEFVPSTRLYLPLAVKDR